MAYAWNVNDPAYRERSRGYDDDQGFGEHAENIGLKALCDAATVSTSRHNNGLGVTVRGYADTEEGAVRAAARAAEGLAAAAKQYGWANATKPNMHPTAESLERDREYGDRRARPVSTI